MWTAIFYVCTDVDEATFNAKLHLDAFVSFPYNTNDVISVYQMFSLTEDDMKDDKLIPMLETQFPGIESTADSLHSMEYRAQINPHLKGPFKLTSDVEITREHVEQMIENHTKDNTIEKFLTDAKINS